MVPWRNWVRWESAGAMHCPLWLGMGRGCCVQCSSIGFCPGLLSAVVGGGLWCSFVLVCSSRVQVGAVWVRDRPVCGATAESPRRYGQTRMYLLISLSMLVVTDMYAGSEPVCIACMLCFRWWLQGVRTWSWYILTGGYLCCLIGGALDSNVQACLSTLLDRRYWRPGDAGL